MLSQVPLWVPAVLLLLVGLGVRQSRPRLMAPATALGIGALMVALSLVGLWSTFGADPATLLCWALGLGLALAAGGRWLAPRGMTLAAGAPAGVRVRVRVPGSWLPLALMLGIFALKFVLGYEAATGHPVTAHSLAGAAVAGLLGGFSGSFLARALAVRRFARRVPVTAP